MQRRRSNAPEPLGLLPSGRGWWGPSRSRCGRRCSRLAFIVGGPRSTSPDDDRRAGRTASPETGQGEGADSTDARDASTSPRMAAGSAVFVDGTMPMRWPLRFLRGHGECTSVVVSIRASGRARSSSSADRYVHRPRRTMVAKSPAGLRFPTRSACDAAAAKACAAASVFRTSDAEVARTNSRISPSRCESSSARTWPSPRAGDAAP